MSDEETIIKTEDGQLLTAEYKDGQLQIVEVTPFEKNNDTQAPPDSILDESKYIQVVDSSGKGLVQFDLLNFTLVKCTENEDASYQVVGASSSDDGETTLTCVLSNDSNDESEAQDSYVLLQTLENTTPLVKTEDKPKKPLTPTEILDKAKALQKAKALLQSEYTNRSSGRGRKRKSALPPPLELLSSPNFKLFLYSCKMCSFKCNAVKEMSAHKAMEHGSGSRGVGTRNASLQCARCPFRATTHSQLMKHVQDVHLPDCAELPSPGGSLPLNTDDDKAEEEVAEVLVCGACGFESGDRERFRDHIHRAHGFNVMLSASLLSMQENSYIN